MKPAPLQVIQLTLAHLGLLLGTVGVAADRFPTGIGPAGPAVPRAAFATNWTTRPVRLIGLGDSVTAGFGARPGYSYFDRLLVNPPDEFPELRGLNLHAVISGLEKRNLSVSGSTSPQHEKGQLPKLARADTNTLGLVVITTGGNDLIHDYGRSRPREGAMYGTSLAQAGPWITNFEARIERMLTRIREAFPGGCQIFLATIYDPTDGVGDIERAGLGLPRWKDGLEILRRYNDVLRRAATRHPDVHLVDLHALMLGHGIHCTDRRGKHYQAGDPHYLYFENLEDPNERGYDAIRRQFLIEMAKVLKPSP